MEEAAEFAEYSRVYQPYLQQGDEHSDANDRARLQSIEFADFQH